MPTFGCRLALPMLQAATRMLGKPRMQANGYDGSTWQAGQGNLSKEIVLNLKMNSTSDYNGNGDGNTFSVYLGPRNRSATGVCIASGWGGCP